MITEPFKVIWGSSTHALEGARDRAISKTYGCNFDVCYDVVLGIVKGAREEPAINSSVIEKSEESSRIPPSINNLRFLSPSAAVSRQSRYVLFINERSRKRMVVMGIPGNVNTTEVGIFFSELKKSETKIDISSLSSTAKERVAQAVFEELDKKFQELK